MIHLLGWLGTVCLIAGLYGVGSKRRNAWLFSMAGEAFWFAKAVLLDMPDLAAICFVFFLLALRAWSNWGKG